MTSRLNTRLKLFTPMVSGVLFGLGLSISGMTDPQRVLHFLDITGQWNPSLLIVLMSAVITTHIGYRIVFRNSTPLFDSQFHLPQTSKIDTPLILGAATFGIGWGLSGYCPGASLAALGQLHALQAVAFLISMLLGMGLARVLSPLFR